MSVTSSYPRIFRLRQIFDNPRIEDVAVSVESELRRLQLGRQIKPGQTVAVTAGSRGIANIQLITKAIVDHLRGLKAKPFIVPAMGSHGGGTVAGQLDILAGYGITDESMGCPIRATMETVVVCQTAEGFPVYFDRYAFEADHVFVCGRIKPHTSFAGEIESGLMKMMLIGLGKHDGAKIYHRAIQDHSFGQIVRSVAGHVIEKCHVVAGLAVVENAYDQTALLRAVAPQAMEQHEKELLVLAKQWMPRLPFDTVDVLIVDEIGKNISGTGLDTNVVGRKQIPLPLGEVAHPLVRRIIVRGLTEVTHGNACGIGLADFCTSRLVRQLDPDKTAINSITGGHPEMGRVPIHYETDRESLDAALSVVGLVEPAEARVLWIKNTLHLAEAECSVAYLAEVQQRADLEILTNPRELPLDTQGNLPSFVSLASAGHKQIHPQ